MFIVFAKGEIIMNNIYKVIWSKARNCYVVASEIAKSHTKSASGQSVRRSALASLLALSLLCGGWGAASASLEVVDQSGTAGTVTIYTKDEVDKALEAKGAATDVASNTANIAANKDNINKLDTKKLDKDVANSTFATKDALNDLEAVVNNKMDESAVETALEVKADKATTLEGYGITDAYTKGDVDNKLNEKADAANVFTKDQTYTRDQVNTKLADYAKTTDVNTALAGKANVGDSYTKAEADGQITTAKNELGDKITANTTKIDANKTAIDDLKTKAATTETTLTDLSGRMAAAESDIGTLKADVSTAKSDIGTLKADMTTAKSDIGTLKADVSTAKSDINSLKMKDTELTGKIEAEIANRITSDTALDNKIDAEIANRITSDTALDNKIDTEIQDRKDAIKATNDRTGGIARNLEGTQTTIEGIVKVDNQGNVKNVKNLGAETITTTGNAAIGGELGVTGATTLDGALTAKGEATFKDKVSVEKDLTVNGKLNVGEISMKNDKLDAATGNKHDSATSITADGISNIASIENGGTTTKSQFSHNEKGTFNSASKGDSTDWKEATSNVTADGVENIAKDSKGNNNTFTQTSTDTKNTLTDKEGNTSTTRQDSKGVYGYAKDKDGNKSYTKQEGNRIAESVIGQDGKETKSEMTSTDITNTAKDGIITNDAKDIVNNATGDMTNTVGGNLTTTVGGNEIHDVKGTKTETVEGKVTENFKGGQETNVTGDQTTNVSGTQTTNATDINRNASSGMIDKVDNAYGTNTETKVAGKTTTEVSIKGTGETAGYIRGATESRDYLIKGTLKNSESKTVETTSTEITDGNGKISTTIQDVTQISGSVTDGTNTSVSNVKADSIDSAVAGGTSISTINQKKDSITSQVTDGTTITKTEQTAKDITNTAKDGTITNDAKDIVNKASGDMTNTVGGKLTTTVTGATEENYNGGLTTKVTGEEKHTVTGKQTNTVEGGQENIISGGQTNTITGGQVNNITGDQTTTITGNKKETVTENVTEDYKKNLTTTVGGNEIHEVKGTKTETVEGKVTENFKGGQETNVTGDQTTNVSGTQTTNATDINRNASSGMIDKVDNDYGTNTETKVAGKTTTDVSIKGTGEKGQYIRGANESRDYLIKGTLKNSETKTAETTSTEITDGNGNISATIQDAKNLAGSVNNGTETGVSGIHANDDGSVSIDSIVTDGSTSSVINQKKDSIQSAVGDGNSSTVIRQDKDNVTIASSNGTVAIGGKDIINNAQDTITNTAGTKITDTAGDSTVTTENGKGTTFSKTGSTAYREGGPTDTNISGNTITTGKVTMDYAEVMKDLGVRGNANIAGKTTTGELEVTGKSTLKGDVTMESNATVKKDLTVEGTTTTKTLKVTENATVGGTLDVAKKATFQDAVDIAKDLSVGGNATIKGDVTAKSYKVGDKTYISADGINANDQKITNVADGSISEGSKDAVNGGQLYGMKRDLEHQVDKVGANAAAMANLHPMEFDPGSKWNIAAAMGNYGSETAAALGAFYRPNDDVMVNLSTAFGTGENMVGGGVSVRLGKGGNKLSREESNALKAQVADLTARMDALLSVLNPNMSKDFPDVPENHWAYEAVSRLAGNDIIQGYPDGEFHGDRTMTRYEMAEIIYNALSRGAEAEKELVEEFKPELQAMAASEKATAEKAEG